MTSIGNYAFEYCSSLTSVTIPESVTSIGNWAFSDCSSLPVENNLRYADTYLVEAVDKTLPTYSIKEGTKWIGGRAFSDCSSLTSITIPNSVTSIGNYAFSGCSSLPVENNLRYADTYLVEAVDKELFTYSIKEGTKWIGTSAFEYCSRLTFITIPNSVTSIGYMAFYDCTSLAKTNYIGDIDGWCDIEFGNGSANPMCCSHNFYINDQEVKDLVIPNTVDRIHNYAFYGCSSLISITIPNSVTSIGEEAFYGCSRLTSITIPNSVASIGSSAFSYCSRLTSVTIPESVTSIGKEAFYRCTSLAKTNYIGDIDGWCGIEFGNGSANPMCCSHNFYINDQEVKDLVIPNTVDRIHNYAFYGCSSLISITIPNSVTSIGEEAFYGCSSLKSIFSLPLLPPAIESYAFSSNVYDDATLYVLSLDYRTHDVWKRFNNISLISICSEGICYKVIPKSGAVLSESLLTENSFNTFTSVSVAGTQRWSFDSEYGAKMSGYQNNATHTNEDWLISPALDLEGCSSATLTFLHAFGPKAQVPTSSSQKAQYTIWVSNDFEGDVESATWTQLSGMEYGTTAWGYVSSSDITIPTENLKANCRVAWKYICTSSSATWEIKNVSVSATTDANDKPQLQVINGEIPYSGDIVIPAVVKYNDLDLEVISISSTAFRGCDSLNSITIPESVTSIGEETFEGCSSLTSITIPNSITSIGSSAFEGCSSLTSITIPNSITSIGSSAFEGCSSLNSIIWNAKNYADFSQSSYSPFYDIRSQITSFTFGNSVEHIPAYLCYGMNNLTSVITSNATTSIGENAFAGCVRLGKATLGTGITNIAASAFAECNRLYDVYCYATYPPFAEESSFASYNVYLYIPCENKKGYELDVVWGKFKFIECIEAETITTDTVVVTPSFNDAEFIWPSNSSADSYTLVISKDGEVFCTLTFNANGQLTSIAFAPSRNGQHHAPAAAQTTDGFAFTVTGLDEGSKYTYDLLIKDRRGNTLQSYSGEFRTQSENDRTVTVEYDALQGIVSGAGTYLVGDTVTLTATANEGYRFVRWSNEVVDNPYIFVISDNVTLSAEFEKVVYTSTEEIQTTANTQKLLHNGQLIIVVDGVEYDVMGNKL